MQRSTVAWLLAACAIAVAAPALAAQGGNGNGGGRAGTTSNIELASVSTPAGATLAAVTPKYGDIVRFSTTVEKLAGWEYPMVALTCYQDVNGDGRVDTNMFGPDIVFEQLNYPDSGFLLSGGSRWAARGGAATCRADLDAYGWSNKVQSIRILDSTEFNVSG